MTRKTFVPLIPTNISMGYGGPKIYTINGTSIMHTKTGIIRIVYHLETGQKTLSQNKSEIPTGALLYRRAESVTCQAWHNLRAYMVPGLIRLTGRYLEPYSHRQYACISWIRMELLSAHCSFLILVYSY